MATKNTNDNTNTSYAPPASGRPVQIVPMDLIHVDNKSWPRDGLDDERIGLFKELYANEPETVPPIEVFLFHYKGREKPSLVLVDGRHRHAAKEKMRAVNIPVVIRDDLHTMDDAFLAACEHSANASKPLTSKQKRAAVRRILKSHPQMSNREIARKVGCSHSTVNTERNPLRRGLGKFGDSLTGDGPPPAPRSEPASLEGRVITLFIKADPDIDELESYLREPDLRPPVERWVRAFAQAYDATDPATIAAARAAAGTTTATSATRTGPYGKPAGAS